MIGSRIHSQVCSAMADGDFERALNLLDRAGADETSCLELMDLFRAICSSRLGRRSISQSLEEWSGSDPDTTLVDVCSAPFYRSWCEAKQTKISEDLRTSLCYDHLLFSVLIDCTLPWNAASLEGTLQTLNQQEHANVEVVLLLRGKQLPLPSEFNLEEWRLRFATKRGLFEEIAADDQPLSELLVSGGSRLRGDYILTMRPGVLLAPQCLAFLNHAHNQAVQDRDPELIVFDYDRLESAGQYRLPFFHHGWDPDCLIASGLQTASIVFRRQAWLSLCHSARGDLGHSIKTAVASRFPGDASVLVISELLAAVPGEHRLSPAMPMVSCHRVFSPRKLSIIIPNRNAAALLRTCLQFAIGEGDGFAPEVIVVDNGSDDEATEQLYRELAHYSWFRLLRSPGVFNFSRLVNEGAAVASGDVLLLLNNDVEIGGLANLAPCLEQIGRDDVGVVGTTLLYPNLSIQHAGVIISPGGVTQHVLRGARQPIPASVRIYLAQPHNYQAVTGAFMLVKKQDFEAVGGFNEVNLPVECNDIDFCLRIRELGLRVLCQPCGQVIHHESLTRGKDVTPDVLVMRKQAVEYMCRRWPDQVESDPFRSTSLCIGDTPVPFLLDPASGCLRYDGVVAAPVELARQEVDEEQIKDLIFDEDWYLTANSDVRESGRDPYYHYMQHGWSEGRLPCGDFLFYQYESIFPDYQRTKANLLLDILQRVQHGQLTLQQVSSLRGRGRTAHDTSVRLEDSMSVHGYLTSEIGLGQAARTLCRSMDAARIRASFFAFPLPGRENEEEFKSKMAAVQRSKVAVSMLPLPLVAPQLLPGRHNILYGVWELSSPPPNSDESLRRYDSIWVPSSFVQRSLGSIGLEASVIPHAIPCVDEAEEILKSCRRRPDQFTVLSFLDFDSYFQRKNPLAAIEAFKLAFARDDDVRLIVKVRGMGGHADRVRLSDVIGDDPRIHLLDKTISRQEIDRLIASADCFLSLHRAEGFGFGCAEALALERIVVATDYGGVTDFVNEQTGYPVNYQLVPLRPGDYHHFVEGECWADPCLDHASSQLRRARDRPGESRQRAGAGRAAILKDYSVAAVGQKVCRWLSERGLLSL